MKNNLLICLCMIFFLTGCAQSTNETSQKEVPQVTDFKRSGWYQEVLSKLENCVTVTTSQVISTDLIITVFIELNQDGSINRIPIIDTKGGTNEEILRYAPQMARAIKRCAPYDFLPKDKFDEWASFSVNFIPSEIFK